MIDIGANIGDTIAACFAEPTDRFLAIEPDPHFLHYLRKNCATIENCTALEVLCGPVDADL